MAILVATGALELLMDRFHACRLLDLPLL